MFDYLIVMTACIDPSTGSAAIQRSDPPTRLRDYRRALRFWIDHPDARLQRILFLENSGHTLHDLKIEAANNPLNKQIEFVSLRCNEVPDGLSYGYAELRMLDLGTAQSTLAREARYLCKVTGRLMFPQLPRLLDRLPRDFDFAVDARRNALFVPAAQEFITTQLMIFSTDFYESNIRKLWTEMPGRGHALIENLLWDELMRFRDKPGGILRWPVNVDPVGYAAHWNKNYRSPRQRVINLLRAAARRVIPNWWV